MRVATAFFLAFLLALTPPVRGEFPLSQSLQSPPVVLNRLDLRFSISDLEIPSHDLPLRFIRTYSSSLNREIPPVLGVGWMHSYQMGLRIERGDPAAAIFTDSEGRRYVFERRLDGSYVSPPLIKAALIEEEGSSGYRLAFKDKTDYLFNAQGRLERIETKNKNTAQLVYDAESRLARVRSSGGAWLELAYDEESRLTEVKGSDGRVAKYLHEGIRLVKAVDWLGSETAFRYDETDRLTEMEDPLHRVARVAYDPNGNLQSVADPAGHATAYEFISSGYFETEEGKAIYSPNRVTVTDPMGGKTVTTYNDLGNPLSVEDPAGNKTFYAWDRMGNLTGVVDAAGARTELVYDEDSNLIAAQDPLRNRHEFLYDGRENLIEVKDPKGNAAEFTYSSQDRLSEVKDLEGAVTRLTYTPEGEVAAVVDALGRPTAFRCNRLGQQTAVTDARGNTVSYAYNDRNEPAGITNPQGQEKKILTDPAHRQQRVLYPDGREVLYRYDAAGRLLSASDADTTLTFEYDALDRMTAAATTSSLRGASATKQSRFSYEYDALGRRAKMTDPSGQETLYAYDPAGNLTGLTQPNGETLRFEYDKVGRRTAVLFPNSVKTSYRYDAAGNVLEIKSENLQTKEIISRLAYTYDELGNCVSKEDGQGETLYRYDKLSRLVEMTDPSSVVTAYTYDKVGNRLTLTVPSPLKGEGQGEGEAYHYNELNQLQRQGKTSYEYDESGNLAAKIEESRTTRYRYGFDRLLEQVVLPDGKEITYRYDPLGRRVEKSAPEGVTRYLYDEEDVLSELDGQGNVTRSYLHGPGIDDLLGMADPRAKEPAYFLTDRLGSITEVLDQKGSVTETFAYGPFGELPPPSQGSGPSTSLHQSTVRGEPVEPRSNLAFLYTGRQHDPETGLYYYRNRYYAADTGRFTTQDPIGLLAGPNLYAYVGNNPINLTDPWGLHSLRATSSPPNSVVAGSLILAAPAGWQLLVIAAGFAAAYAIYLAGGYRFPLPFPYGWGVPGPHNTFKGPGLFQPFNSPNNRPPWVQWAAWGLLFAKTVQIVKSLYDKATGKKDGSDASMPEPTTAVLAGLGVVTMAAYYKRRRRTRA